MKDISSEILLAGVIILVRHWAPPLLTIYPPIRPAS